MSENQAQLQQNQVPPDLLIKGHELQQLDTLIGNFPTTYGYKIIQFFQYVQKEREQERIKTEQAKTAIEKTAANASPAPENSNGVQEQNKEASAPTQNNPSQN